MEGNAHFAQVIFADDALSTALASIEDGQLKSGENADDGHDHEQFHQRERFCSGVEHERIHSTEDISTTNARGILANIPQEMDDYRKERA
jgi:hypothetical protein